MRLASLCLLLFATTALAQDREVTACESCGAEVYQTPKSYKSGNTKYIYMYDPPHKSLCTACQREANNEGLEPGEAVAENPWAVESAYEKPKRKPKDKHTEEAESGFGASGFMIGIVLVIAFALRFFLKS